MARSMAAMRSASSMSMPGVVRLAHIRLLLLPGSTMPKRQCRRNKKEDTIHNPKRKTGLQHRTLFIRLKIHPLATQSHIIAKIDFPSSSCRDVGAVFHGDEAQVVDAGDEGADETEVDEADEAGVGFRTVVGEESADCPGGGEDGDDEEDEDVCWG